MRHLLIPVLLLLLAGCNGGSEGSRGNVGDNTPGALPELLSLELTSLADGANTRVVLEAQSAADLYQIAASLSFDPAAYEVLSVEAGGGLGDPQDSFFTHGLRDTGQLDFAYTRRYSGAGASGDLAILHVVVRPLGEFSLADFSIDRTAGRIVARDSLRRDLAVLGDGEVQ